MKNIMKLLVGSLVALAIIACGGPVGPQGEPGGLGPKGDKGENGEGFEAGPSISALFPTEVFTGETEIVQISGFATAWTSAAKVDFGQGVTVKNVTVASPTALVAEIEVGHSATAGARTVTVTEGTSVAKFENVFTIKRLIEAEVLGTVTQGSASMIRLRRTVASFAWPTTAAQVRSTLDGSNGLFAVPWVASAEYLDIALLANVNASTGTQDFAITLFPGAANEQVIPVAVTVGTSNIGTAQAGANTVAITEPFKSVALKFTAAEAGDFLASISADGGEPFITALGSSGSFVDTIGDLFVGSIPVPAEANDEIYLIVWDDSGVANYDATLTIETLTSVSETEPNDDPASALVLASVPAQVTSTLESVNDVDFVKFAATAADVGRRIRVQTMAGDPFTDPVVQVLGSDGVTSMGVSSDVNYHENLLSQPIPAAGDYYVRVFASSQFDPDDGTAYVLSVTLE